LTALPVSAAAAGAVTLKDGVLTLSGAVTAEQIQAYKENQEVEDVIAADDCILPENCRHLFYVNQFHIDTEWSRLTSVVLTAADASHVTRLVNFFCEFHLERERQSDDLSKARRDLVCENLRVYHG